MKALIDKCKARIEEINDVLIEISHKIQLDKDLKNMPRKYLFDILKENNRLLAEKQTLDDIIKDMEELESNTFTFTGKATIYPSHDGVMVDTDGLSLCNGDLPLRAYTLKEGKTYEVSVKEINQPKQ